VRTIIVDVWMQQPSSGASARGWSVGTSGLDRSPMGSLSGPKGGHHLSRGWVDDGVPVYYDGWDRLVAVSHRPDKSCCVGVRPDVDLVD
jgi:hypothetical protein